ncbi:MAG: hypothetical protein ACREBR_00920, partial [bacterium]
MKFTKARTSSNQDIRGIQTLYSPSPGTASQVSPNVASHFRPLHLVLVKDAQHLCHRRTDVF